MKIQCDVCNKHHASLFCTVDEAALCDGCDRRVYHANNLASKHQRFSLTYPSAKHFPLCDVCQERRAFVFCQQDRAILCKECDVPIHSANDFTKKHNRFLLTGIKLSETATPYYSSKKKPHLLDSSEDSIPPCSYSPSTASVPIPAKNPLTNEEAGLTGSSISEYLVNTIPGMKFEDFFDSHSVPFALSKNGDEMLSLFGEGNMISFSEKPSSSVYLANMDEQNGIGYSRSSLGDDNFIVPQMSTPNNVSKRSRLLW